MIFYIYIVNYTLSIEHCTLSIGMYLKLFNHVRHIGSASILISQSKYLSSECYSIALYKQDFMNVQHKRKKREKKLNEGNQTNKQREFGTFTCESISFSWKPNDSIFANRWSRFGSNGIFWICWAVDVVTVVGNILRNESTRNKSPVVTLVLFPFKRKNLS